MKLVLKSENSGVCSYTASFSKEEFEIFVQENLGKVSEKIKGFRPGKAPAKIALNQEQNSEIIKNVIGKMFTEAKKQIYTKDNYLSYKEPILKDVNFGEAGVSLIIESKVLDLNSLERISSLSFQKYEYEKSEEEKDIYIDLVKDDQIILDISDRPIQRDDIVEVSGYCLINNALYKHEISNSQLALSESLEFQSKLIGKTIGEEVVVTIKYDHSNPNNFLRSKTIEYHLTINKIKNRPIINSLEDFTKYRSQVTESEFNLDNEIEKRCKAIAWVVSKYKILISIADMLEITPDDKQINAEARELATLHGEKDIETFKNLSNKKLKIFIAVQGLVKKYNISYSEEELNKFKEEFADQLFGIAGAQLKAQGAVEAILLEDLVTKAIFQKAAAIDIIKVDAVTLNAMLEEHCQ